MSLKIVSADIKGHVLESLTLIFRTLMVTNIKVACLIFSCSTLSAWSGLTSADSARFGLKTFKY